MSEGPRVLVISDDDDVSEPLAALLKRAGYRVGVRGAREGIDELEGPPPDALIVDRDLPPALYDGILSLLEAHPGAASFPLLILGGLAVARPPQPGELLASLAALRRLAFYRPYRDLVHDLSQPVTTIHALSRSIAQTPPADETARRSVESLLREADRLMSLVEEFQRRRASSV